MPSALFVLQGFVKGLGRFAIGKKEAPKKCPHHEFVVSFVAHHCFHLDTVTKDASHLQNKYYVLARSG
jgi:hypothetical protein